MPLNKFIVGNWKMNGNREQAREFLRSLAPVVKGRADVALCLPYTLLETAESHLTGCSVQWGAQDVSPHPNGAHTGDVSAAMLNELGCRYVLVGHSERRTDHDESDDTVLAKIRAALAQGIQPIICVGESLSDRQAGTTAQVVLEQVDRVVRPLDPIQRRQCVIAYEPIWAIGTGLTATPEQAQAVHALIRQRLEAIEDGLGKRLRILYGGSVKPESAPALFAQKDIDGGLIGGASLSLQDFAHLIKIAEHYALCDNDFFDEGI